MGGGGDGLFGFVGAGAAAGAERRALRRSAGCGGGGHSGRADPVQDVMDRLGVAMSGGTGSGSGHARSMGMGVGVGEQTSVPSVPSVPSVLAGLGGRAAVRGVRGMVERAGVGEFSFLFFFSLSFLS